MIKHSMLVGYDPRCLLLKRKRKGGTYFQLQYQLPGGQRRQVSLGHDKIKHMKVSSLSSPAFMNFSLMKLI